MGSLLKAEIRQLLRRRAFWIFVAGMAAIFWDFYSGLGNVKRVFEVNGELRMADSMGLMIRVMGRGINEFSTSEDVIRAYVPWAFAEVLSEMNPVLMITVFYAAMLPGNDFVSRTIGLPIRQGYSRGKVYFVKAIIYYVSAMTVSLLFLVLFLCSKFGTIWLRLIPAGRVAVALLLWFYIGTGTLCVPFLIAFLCRDRLNTLLFSFLLFFAGFLLTVFSSSSLKYWLPQFIGLNFNLWYAVATKPFTQWPLSLFSPGLFVLTTGILAYRIFQNVEMK